MFFESAKEAEITRENGSVVLRPVDLSDPIVQLGESPVACGLDDASEIMPST